MKTFSRAVAQACAWIALLVTMMTGASSFGQPAARIELLDAAGRLVPEDRPFQPGDRLNIFGPSRMMIRLGIGAPECLIYSPDGHVVIPIPLGTQETNAFAPGAFAMGRGGCFVRPATDKELRAYRNLALNPWDVRGRLGLFPHASSNSECRDDPVFAARNAIDGAIANQNHGGWPAQSWGPEQRADLWWKLEFGRPVEIDKLVIYIRADFPHDKHWNSAKVRFSDGSSLDIKLRKTAEPQTFAFDKRTVAWFQLDGLTQELPLGWCGLTEVQAFGRDASQPVPNAGNTQ